MLGTDLPYGLPVSLNSPVILIDEPHMFIYYSGISSTDLPIITEYIIYLPGTKLINLDLFVTGMGLIFSPPLSSYFIKH